jgi:hypothetical protein
MGADGWRVAARTRGTLRRFLGFTGNLFILGLFKLQANSYFKIQEGRSKHDIFTKQFPLKNASLFNDSSFKRVAIFGSVSRFQDARLVLEKSYWTSAKIKVGKRKSSLPEPLKQK